jgi:Tol biopolymer transport system component
VIYMLRIVVWIMALLVPSVVMADDAIAHLRLTAGYWQVWLMNAEGKQPKQLTDTDVDKVNISWGPGDRELLYSTNEGETWIIDLSTQKARRVLQDVVTMDANWSPDGKSLAYGVNPADGVHGYTTLWLSDLDGNNRIQIADKLSGDISGAQWFANGNEMVFLQCKIGPDFRVHHEFWRSSASAEGVEQITADKHLLKFEQAVSPNGKMAYSSAATGHFEIWRLDDMKAQPVQLTQFASSAGNPAWSPDTRKIAFDAEQKGWGIFVMQENGKQVTRLTPENVLARRPEWNQGLYKVSE